MPAPPSPSGGSARRPVVLASASGGVGAWAWPRLAAVYIMAIAPGLIFFALTQRWYMKGIQEGALKA